MNLHECDFPGCGKSFPKLWRLKEHQCSAHTGEVRPRIHGKRIIIFNKSYLHVCKLGAVYLAIVMQIENYL